MQKRARVRPTCTVRAETREHMELDWGVCGEQGRQIRGRHRMALGRKGLNRK